MTARAEYQRGIMDALSDPLVHTVVFMKAAQVGATEMLLNVVGYHIDQDPAPILLIQPTLEMAEAWSKDRLAPMLRDTPSLRGKVKDARSRDSGNTLRLKEFPGGRITMAGANSPASLASRPIRIVLCDEVDRYPLSAGSEGDPVRLAEKRSTTFWNRKLVLASTPTIEGSSRIAAAFEQSDKRRFFVPCPDCGHMQDLRWQQVTFDAADPAGAAYACEECGVLWADADRWAAIRRGEWRATAEFHGTAGFHLTELCSPWRRLEEMVRDFLAAKGHPEQLKTWINTALGETWRERGEAPEWERLYERREDYPIGRVPSGGLVLTAGADVQKDRIEVSVWAWGREHESWLVEHRVIQGDPAGSDVWAEMSDLLADEWDAVEGQSLRLSRLAIDTGGHHTQAVYGWCRQQRPGLVMAVKGATSISHPALGTAKDIDVTAQGRRIKRGVKLWTIGVGVLKAEFYGWLRQPMPEDGLGYPKGYVHLPRVDPEFCQQLVAEQLVTLRSGRREWQKLRERNEALDCRIYARAAAIAEGLDRWSDAHWHRRERELGLVEEPRPWEPPSSGPGSGPAPTSAQTPPSGGVSRFTRPTPQVWGSDDPYL